MHTRKTKTYFDEEAGQRKIVPNSMLQRKSQFNIEETHSCYEGPGSKVYAALDLDLFKRTACPDPDSHSLQDCPHFHSPLDSRRQVHTQPLVCPVVAAGSLCPSDEGCPFAHNNYELLFLKQNYRRKLCLAGSDCQVRHCPNAHSEQELTILLIHKYDRDKDFHVFYFKTIFCPFPRPHPEKDCVYAHNWADFRRSPVQFSYRPSLCPNWRPDPDRYGCPRGLSCDLSHGWLQLNEHPSSQCVKDSEFQLQIFSAVPRNRLVRGRFKQRRGRQGQWLRASALVESDVQEEA